MKTEQISTFISQYNELVDRADHVLRLLSQIDEEYEDIRPDHIKEINEWEIAVAAWNGWHNCDRRYDVERIPLAYLFDENWMKEAQNIVNEKKALEQQKKEQEQKELEAWRKNQELKEYERLKIKFEDKNQ